MMSVACAYFCTLVGFLSGVSGCLLATLHMGGSLLHHGMLGFGDSAGAAGQAVGIEGLRAGHEQFANGG